MCVQVLHHLIVVLSTLALLAEAILDCAGGQTGRVQPPATRLALNPVLALTAHVALPSGTSAAVGARLARTATARHARADRSARMRQLGLALGHSQLGEAVKADLAVELRVRVA
jgi:hypothetical protein